MSCSSCGQSSCSCGACPSTLLNQPRLLNPIVSGGSFTNGQYQSPTIAGGTAINQSIQSAVIDCLSTVCTQPPGTNNGTLASTAFVNQAILDGYGTPEFCDGVIACTTAWLASNAFCPIVADCLNDVPGIINSTSAFGPGARATEAEYGVARYATLSEVLAGACGVALQPCRLIDALNSPVVSNPFWNAFNTAVTTSVTSILSSPSGCALVNPCITAYVNSGNPAFCAQVNACVSISDIWVDTTGDTMTGHLVMTQSNPAGSVRILMQPTGAQSSFMIFDGPPALPLNGGVAGSVVFQAINDFNQQTGGVEWYSRSDYVSPTGHCPFCPSNTERAFFQYVTPSPTGEDFLVFSAGGSPTPLVGCASGVGAGMPFGAGFLFQMWDGSGTGYFPLMRLCRSNNTYIRTDGTIELLAPQGLSLGPGPLNVGAPGLRLTSQGPGLPPIWAP